MKTRHTVWIDEKIWERMELITKKLQKKTRKKIHVSDIINNACNEYKRTELETLHEEKKAIARKINMLQNQILTIDNTINAAVEAKEKLEITPPKDTYARISFQRFFRMYRKLSGMTGTASEAAAEFWQIYHLPVVVIPTNRPCKRKNLPDIVMTTGPTKWKRILLEISRVHERRQPVLVGTRSVQASEYISQLLDAENLNHQVLNAVRHREEAQIIASAGQAGKITVATNMAGRGTDIKLGRGVAELGGLHVIASERNESGRIDRQLFGRCARQGDPGSAQAIVCLEDEFVSRYAKNIVAYLKKRHALNTDGICSKTTRAAFRLAQRRAEKLALRQRKSVMRTDHWLEEQLSFSGRE